MYGNRLLALLSICFAVVVPAFIAACSAAPAQQVEQTVQPVLVCRPDTLAFTVRADQLTTVEHVINIANQGGGELYWTISDNARWMEEEQSLEAEVSRGGLIRVIVDPEGLVAGEYTGTVTITAEGALNSPCHVPVSLIVTAVEVAGGQDDGEALDQKESLPADSAVIWKNKNELFQRASVSSCIVSGNIHNTDKRWSMKDVTIVASHGSAYITALLLPGESVIYNRYIPCYQREEVKLKYTWIKH